MASADKLYAKADTILDGRSTGLAMPILQTLAHRRLPEAETRLSNILDQSGNLRGRRIALDLLRRGVRQRDATATYNVAIHYRNRNKLRLYRYFLTRAATLDRDPYAIREIGFFETRFPHGIVRQYRRLRPWAARDDWQCD